jgi:AraC-like DNA-binding protein
VKKAIFQAKRKKLAAKIGASTQGNHVPRQKTHHWEALSKAVFHEDGLDSYVGAPNLMPLPHRHNEIEINFLDSGAMTSIIGENRVTLKAGFLQVFWAGIPHQVIAIEPGTRNRWITLPLHLCATWRLPHHFLRHIFFSKFSVEEDPSQGPHDRAMLDKWHADLKSGSAERREITLMETQARLRRLALQMKGDDEPGDAKLRDGLFEAGTMSIYIAQNYRRPIEVEDVAGAARLRPNAAMKIFRRIFGTSIMGHVNHLRVQHAQGLLRESDAKVIEVALDSGFGSLTTFYRAFQRLSGLSPKQFRSSSAGGKPEI